MNATLPVSTIHPFERVAHRAGLALVRWSTERAERRVHRHVTPVAEPASLAALHAVAQDREARERSWERLARTSPRVR